MFGTTNTEFIHLLEGNTKLLKNPRSLTKAVLPANFACWTLPLLHGALDYYFFQVYGRNEHPAHGEPPSEHLPRRMAETGERWNRLVRFDQTFCIETCPSPADRPTRVVGQRGIKISYLYYWNPILVRPDLRNQEFEVRMDPWDPGIAYLLIANEWHLCLSKVHATLSRYSEVERRCAMAELTKKHSGRIRQLTPERIAEWLHALNPKNFDAKLAEEQTELRALYADLGMTDTLSTARPDDFLEPEAPTARRRRARPTRGLRPAAPEAPEPPVTVEDQDPQGPVAPETTPNQTQHKELDHDYSLF